MNSKKTILILASVLALVLVGYFVNKKRINSGLVTLIGADNIKSQGGKIEFQPITSDAAAVALDIHHVVVFNAKMSPEAKILVLKNISTLQTELELKSGQADFNVWNSLAQYYQVAEDYAAAAEVWEYLGRVFPANHVAYGNLGFLYGYYLKDVARAEQNYLKAIENAPNQAFLYFQTAEFYRDVMKSTSKALAIAQQGLTKNPQNAELKQLVQSLK